MTEVSLFASPATARPASTSARLIPVSESVPRRKKSRRVTGPGQTEPVIPRCNGVICIPPRWASALCSAFLVHRSWHCNRPSQGQAKKKGGTAACRRCRLRLSNIGDHLREGGQLRTVWHLGAEARFKSSLFQVTLRTLGG